MLCAKWLNVTGFSWGNTVYAVTNFLCQKGELSDVIVVQLCGGISNVQNNIYSSEIAKISQRHGMQNHMY